MNQTDIEKAFSDALLYGDGHLIIRNTGSGFEILHIDRELVTITEAQKMNLLPKAYYDELKRGITPLPSAPWFTPKGEAEILLDRVASKLRSEHKKSIEHAMITGSSAMKDGKHVPIPDFLQGVEHEQP